jgi:hypothetical protein
MELTTLTYIIFEINAALDSGGYDDLPVQEVGQHIEAGDVVPWLKGRLLDADLSLLTEQSANEYQACLADIYGAYAGNERRKWGVENRGLCLLIAWTAELIQRRCWQADEGFLDSV